MNAAPCPLCEKTKSAIQSAASLRPSHLIHEFQHSLLFVGSHQRFEGYCVLVSKTHAREPFELPSPAREEMLAELLMSAQAIQAAFRPLKLNYGCYGNQVEHIHWHLFPRYENDPLKKEVPWAHSAEFAAASTTEVQAREVSKRVRAALSTVPY